MNVVEDTQTQESIQTQQNLVQFSLALREQKTQGGKGLSQTLRKLHFFFMVILNFQNRKLLIPNSLWAVLLEIVQDQNAPTKVKIMCSFVLREMTSFTDNVEFINSNLKEKYDTTACQALLPVVIARGESTCFQNNINNFVYWFCAQTPEFYAQVIPAILVGIRGFPEAISPDYHIQPLESKAADYLQKASMVSAGTSTGISIFNFALSNSNPEPITELDGTQSREFFTLLNQTQSHTDDQLYNTFLFSGLYRWVSQLYAVSKNENKETKSVEKLNSESSASPAPLPEQKKQAQPAFALKDGPFKESIILYCLRIIEQCKLKPHKDVSRQTILTASLALQEAIKILDVICLIDSSLIPRFCPVMKAIFSRTSTTSDGPLLLALMQFLVNHGETVMYDLGPIFRCFFVDYLPQNYHNQLIALEVFDFCNRNKGKLLSTTQLFSTYYPALLKLFVWYPRSFSEEIFDLLPSLILPETCQELFHTILDLPLLASAMERSYFSHKGDSSEDLSNPNDPIKQGQQELHVLFNYLLRNECGVSINFWETSTTLPILQKFCRETPITMRIREVVTFAVDLITIYFDATISWAPVSALQDLIPVMWQRINQLFPLDYFQIQVRQVIEMKTLAIFQKYPRFVITFKDLIVENIGDSSTQSKQELILCMCWMIGELTSKSLLPDIETSVWSDFHEALELFAYERMTFAKQGISPEELRAPEKPQEMTLLAWERQQSYATRLMLVLISSLSKLAVRLPSVTSRVLLCFAKLTQLHQSFEPVVQSRANESISILKYASIASCVLDTPHQWGQKPSAVDQTTTLPFRFTTRRLPSPNQNRLHDFTLI